MLCHIAYPTRQDLRSNAFVNDNFLTRCMHCNFPQVMVYYIFVKYIHSEIKIGV